MEIQEAQARYEEYVLIFERNVPYAEVDTKEGAAFYHLLKQSCIEALVILDGDEECFKRCLEAAEAKEKSMGWERYDECNASEVALRVKTLAYLIRKK